MKKLIIAFVLFFPFLAFSDEGVLRVDPHPLVVGKIVRNAEVTTNPIPVLAIAFKGQADGLDIPFQTGVVKLSPSPEVPQVGVLFPKVRVRAADTSFRKLPVPSDISEIVGASIIRRISKPGAERLKFSNGAVLEIIAPRSDPRILMYVEDPNQGGEVAILWDVWPNF